MRLLWPQRVENASLRGASGHGRSHRSRLSRWGLLLAEPGFSVQGMQWPQGRPDAGGGRNGAEVRAVQPDTLLPSRRTCRGSADRGMTTAPPEFPFAFRAGRSWNVSVKFCGPASLEGVPPPTFPVQGIRSWVSTPRPRVSTDRKRLGPSFGRVWPHPPPHRAPPAGLLRLRRGLHTTPAYEAAPTCPPARPDSCAGGQPRSMGAMRPGSVRSTARVLFTARSTGCVTSVPAICSDTSPSPACRSALSSGSSLPGLSHSPSILPDRKAGMRSSSSPEAIVSYLVI